MQVTGRERIHRLLTCSSAEQLERDKAVYSESDGVAAYDVDILADRSIIAIRSKFGPNGAKAERLKVHQKLVVRRNVKTGAMASYVLSLIPDVGCDDRRIPEKFRSRGEKGGFSGIAE